MTLSLCIVGKLGSFWVSSHDLESVYRGEAPELLSQQPWPWVCVSLSCWERSLLQHSDLVWKLNLSFKNRARLARVVNTASKITGVKQKQQCDLYHISVRRKSVSILHDKTHPLNVCFQHPPSGRQLKVPLAKKNVCKKTFIPTAVSVLNAEF